MYPRVFRTAPLAAGLGFALLAALPAATAAPAQGPVAGPAAKAPLRPTRVAVIDVQRLLAESAAGREALEELRRLRERKEAEREAKQKELAALQERFSQGQASLGEEALGELRKELQQKVIAFQGLRESIDRDLQAARDAAFGKVEEKLMPVIAEIGRELGYDAIFNKFQSGLLFAGDDLDVTDLVLERIERSPDAAPRPARPPAATGPAAAEGQGG